MNMGIRFDQLPQTPGTQNLASNYARDGCRGYLSGIRAPKLIYDVDKALPVASVRCDFVLFLRESKDNIIEYQLN